MLKILFLGLLLVLHKTSGKQITQGQHDSELFDRYDEEELSIADNCVTRSDLKNLKQELLDEIGDKIQATMMDAGKRNPNYDPDHGEYPNPDHDLEQDDYPNPDHDLDHDEYPNPDHDPDHDEYPDNQDQYPNQEYSEQDLVPDSPKFQLTG